MTLKRIQPLVLAVAGLLAFAVSACSTVAGAGRDIRDSGQAITGAAEQTRSDMQK